MKSRINRKKIGVTAISVMLVLASITFISFLERTTASPGNVYVDDDAPAGWYDATHVKTIQEGIDNATAEDTIYVWAGTYNEHHIKVNKSLTIIGNGTADTLVHCDALDCIFSIEANDVTIIDVAMENSGMNQPSITSVGYDNLNFTRIKLQDTYGLEIEDCNGLIIADGVFENINNDVFYLYEVVNAEIYNNTVNLVTGLNKNAFDLDYCDHVDIYENHLNDTTGAVLWFWDDNSDINIYNNTITNGSKGIYYRNLGANKLLVYNNYFADNAQQIDNDGSSAQQWNITKTSGTNIIGKPYLGGNYWDDYTGMDTDGDYLGNTNVPYTCGGEMVNGDYLPLTFTANYAPVFSNPNPANGSTGIHPPTLIWNITIEHPQGNTFNWSIETSPDVGSNSSNNDNNGSKQCSLSGLQYGTTYTVYVNATDGDIWINETFWFGTMNQLYVSPDQDAGWYDATHVKTIQEGIDNATAGDTVYVWAGTYSNTDVDKSVTIIGNGTENTIIDGGGSGTIIDITADWVNISGFTVRNTSGKGIWLYHSSNNNISSNNASNNWHGIYLDESDNSTVMNNNVSNNRYGIYLEYSSNNNITDNTVDSNGDDNIRLDDSHYNVIAGNSANSSESYSGILLCNSSYNDIINNIANSNNDDNICLEEDSDYNNITNNVASNGDYDGIHLWQSDYNNITDNTVESNLNCGIYLSGSNSNLVYNNYFSNTDNAYDNGNNVWNISKTLGTNVMGRNWLGGNYWDDYTGMDTDGDYLGDTDVPYTCGGEMVNGDYLPLTFTTSYGPVFSNPNPANGSTGIHPPTLIWNITIEHPQGNTFNWSIETSPDVGSDSDTGDTNGSKSISIAGLQYGTNCTVFVNASFGIYSTNETFWFMTNSTTSII